MASPFSAIYKKLFSGERKPLGLTGKTALVTGSVALGAYLTGTAIRLVRRSTLRRPDELPPALEATLGTLEMMEGQSRFYERPGTGTPLVLLHRFSLSSSAFEIKPLFDQFAETTERPLFALEWLGYGCSDRPAFRYRPALFQRQLRRFLSENLHQPADIIGLGLGGDYAATVAAEAPHLVRKMVSMMPTGLTSTGKTPPLPNPLMYVADGTGAYELFYYHLTRREILRGAYARQMLDMSEENVPHELVNYAYLTTHVKGAHYAPFRFFDGSIQLGEQAFSAYRKLQTPTLLILPEHATAPTPPYDLLAEAITENETFLLVKTLPTGMLPPWEAPEALFEMIDEFLSD